MLRLFIVSTDLYGLLPLEHWSSRHMIDGLFHHLDAFQA